jgi:preprotein translocase subunit SecA
MGTLNDNYRLTAIRNPPKIPTGIEARLSRFLGKTKGSRNVLRKLLNDAKAIDHDSKKHQSLTDDDLRDQLQWIKSSFRKSPKKSDALIPEAMGLIQEAVKRTMGFRPYPVQIAGALALHRGFIAEMSTGEGKTVTAAMAAIVRGWIGLPCHVITANDYLAARDAEILTGLFSFCWVSVGSVTSELKPDERRASYGKDVAYTTPKEILADFLRDRIALGKQQNFERRMIQSMLGNDARQMNQVVMRGIHTAIVDEADNVLIDEAITPLIISREEPNEAFMESCKSAITIANALECDKDYRLEPAFRTVTFLKDIQELIREKQDSNPTFFSWILFQKDLIRQALVAKEFFHRDRQYVIEDEKIVIVDESTGRKMPMRSWSSGLHQLVEAKEGLPMSPVKETQARLSFQRFFRFFHCFSGMTGTGKEAAGEFWHIYGVPVITIPNNRPSKRIILPLNVFMDDATKMQAILADIKTIHALGRPILVGTRTVQKSEEIAALLESAGMPCRVVNAIRQEQEAEIIALAGHHSAITVATNMAGRGTDIKLSREVEALGGLHVLATECHGSSRIDRQLFGRAARQGDHGSATAYTSYQDELLVRNLPVFLFAPIRKILILTPFLKNSMGTFSVWLAQRIAHHKDFQSRLQVQRMDTWLDESLSFAADDVK